MKKKISKNTEKLIRYCFTRIFFMLGLFLVIFGVSSFWIGFHGIDITHNLINLELRYNMTMHDMDTGYNLNDSTYAYIKSINDIVKGFSFVIAGMFMLGMVYIDG